MRGENLRKISRKLRLEEFELRLLPDMKVGSQKKSYDKRFAQKLIHPITRFVIFIYYDITLCIKNINI